MGSAEEWGQCGGHDGEDIDEGLVGHCEYSTLSVNSGRIFYAAEAVGVPILLWSLKLID